MMILQKRFSILKFAFLLTLNANAQNSPSIPLNYTGQSNLVIQNLDFTSGNSGIAIKLSNCTNVKIINCTFKNIPEVIAVQAQNCNGIEVTNCYFQLFRTGVYAISSQSINIHCNSFKDIGGSKPRGQMVQFNNCSGTGNRINYNILDHTFGSGNPEDLINMYASSGTLNDPIQIIGNQLRGGGPSSSGGGIMVGDNDGHDIRIEDNIIVNPGQYGIGCPSGSNITIKNNKVYGKQQSFTNVGIYVGLQSEIDAGFVCNASTIKVENNQVNWFRKDGVKNGFWNCNCCTGIKNIGNNWNASISESILPEVLTLNSTMCSSLSPKPEITDLQLINATNESLITGYENLIGKSIINKTNMNISSFNLYAKTRKEVDSVVFVHKYNGVTTRRKEGTSPYALRGDGAGYGFWNLPLGDHLIEVTAYKNGVSSMLNKLIFKVIDESITYIQDDVVPTVELFPNPVNNFLLLSYHSDWVLNSISGAELKRGSGTKIDLSSYAKGIYLIKINGESHKIVKE